MTTWQEDRKSGLVVPAVPRVEPKPPARAYEPLEIQDEERREMAKDALSKLWDALDLSRGPGGGLRLPGMPGAEGYAAHEQARCFIGEMLLGDDRPSKEILT